MILEQAALAHDIERIFRSKRIPKFQNDEGATQHMAPPLSCYTALLELSIGHWIRLHGAMHGAMRGAIVVLGVFCARFPPREASLPILQITKHKENCHI